MRRRVRQQSCYRLPEGVRIYAIGDIHGMLKPLRQLHAMIEAEERKSRPASKVMLIYLGDYIDRGAHSRQVVDYLLDYQPSFATSLFLKGNHEEAMLRFLENPLHNAAWLKWGGIETLESYGINIFDTEKSADLFKEMAEQLQKALSDAHRQFYQNLQLWHREGVYLFVHAGIRPGVPLEAQNAMDMLSIREPFLSSPPDERYCVVFGHTIFKSPYHKRNKIGVDTGAYMNGRLSCVLLEADRVQFLTTG